MTGVPLRRRIADDAATIAARAARRVGADADPRIADDLDGLCLDVVLRSVHLVDGYGPPPPGPVDRCHELATAAARAGRPPEEALAVLDMITSAVQAELWAVARPGDLALLAVVARRTDAWLRAEQACVQRTWSQERRRSVDPATELADLLEQVREGAPTGPLAVTAVRSAAGSAPAERLLAVARSAGAWTGRASDDTVAVEVVEGTAAAGRVAAALDPVDGTAVAVVGAAGAHELGAAVRRVRHLLDQAGRRGRLGRPQTVDDLLLETRLGRADDRITDPVAPIRGEPELLDTLRALYLCDLSRTAAAVRLGIARRTLTHRLDRVRRRTGLDPTGRRGVQVLAPAVAAVLQAQRGPAARAPRRRAPG